MRTMFRARLQCVVVVAVGLAVSAAQSVAAQVSPDIWGSVFGPVDVGSGESTKIAMHNTCSSGAQVAIVMRDAITGETLALDTTTLASVTGATLVWEVPHTNVCTI